MNENNGAVTLGRTEQRTSVDKVTEDPQDLIWRNKTFRTNTGHNKFLMDVINIDVDVIAQSGQV